MRKDSELFLRDLLEYGNKIGKNYFQINVDYFEDILNISFVINDILDDLIINYCISSKSRVINDKFDIQIYLTMDGLEYFDREKLIDNKSNYTINMSGGQLNIAKNSSTINASNEILSKKKEII